jgi:hypothetical protein
MHRLILSLLAALWATPTVAQGQCAPRTSVVETLASGYGEARSGIGIAANGMVVELFTAPTGTWTLVYTRPDGMTCAIASGEAWEHTKDALPAPGTDG